MDKSNKNENRTVLLCQYCHKKLKKVECSKFNDDTESDVSFHEVVTFLFWVLSLFIVSYKKKLEEHKFKITCVNKDCIGYLDGCMVNKYTTTWQFPKKKRDENV